MKVISICALEPNHPLELALVTARVSAGFPSPAENYVDRKIDLNRELIKHPAATFLVRVEGDSMIDGGILSGDILIVDRSLEATSGKIVVAVVDAEFTVKKMVKRNGKLFLEPQNDQYLPIEVTKEMNCSIWGVVTYAIHSY